MSVLYVRDLARILGVTPHAIHQRLGKRPESVPPPMRIAGRWCWREETVEEWLKEQEERKSFGKKGWGAPRRTPQRRTGGL